MRERSRAPVVGDTAGAHHEPGTFLNLRERHKQRTRAALADAALGLFLERGFDATTIEDVVARAGVSRRTFFRYFPTKEAAFFADQAERLEAFSAAVASRMSRQPPWVAVRESLLATAVAYVSDRTRALAWRRVMRSSPALVAGDLQQDARWEQRIAEAFELDGTPAFEARVRAGAVMGVVRVVLVAWYEDDGRGDLTAMGRQAFRWLELGAATAPLNPVRTSP